ncbi:MAG: hypothetical protein ACFNLC_05945 [Prevotella denticola]
MMERAGTVCPLRGGSLYVSADSPVVALAGIDREWMRWGALTLQPAATRFLPGGILQESCLSTRLVFTASTMCVGHQHIGRRWLCLLLVTII